MWGYCLSGAKLIQRPLPAVFTELIQEIGMEMEISPLVCLDSLACCDHRHLSHEKCWDVCR